jgi:UDPglucose 6-dehydrogenase/GDP-mannose 6-dehydrogenase
MPLLEAVIRTNGEQPGRMVGLLRRHFPSLSGIRVALLGLAFKEGTDDVRESPAIPLAQMLVERGAHVSAYDPFAMEAARALLPSGVRMAGSLEACLSEVDAAMLVTRWPEFQRIPEILQASAVPPLIVDCRRMLPRRSVKRYEGVGL